MRTCANCGKANNPIRKYCTRCGKLLISVKDDKPSPTPSSVVTETPIPDLQSTASTPEEKYVASDSVKVTTDDEWVRPSQVSRGRMRTSSPSSGKSEMEKAKEIFAKADTVGIEEPDGSGVIETRMLRASEVRELMGEGAVLPQETAPLIQPETRPAPPPAPVTPPVATPPPRSEPPPAAPPVAPSPHPVPEAVVIPPPASATNKLEGPAVKPAPTIVTPPVAPISTPPVKPSTPAPLVPSATSISLETRVPEIEDILAQVSEPEDLQDNKIKDLVASLTHQHAELRQVKDDLTKVSARLDEFVRNCQNDAEVKRIHFESINEQARFAKQEYESSKKEYERVDKRRKKENASLEDKVKNVEKNILKSEDAVTKRITELDKVREKIAQLQSQES